MKYGTYIEAKFIKRPNRFLAYCQLGNEEVIAHVPNTGRCAELLIPGATVYLNHVESATRKTAYSLYMVKKGKKNINIDSQAPNKIVYEGLQNKIIQFSDFFEKDIEIKSEYTYGKSRFDFFIYDKSNPENKMLIEVKGVTLERDNIVAFPDAPSIRAVKHITEMTNAAIENNYSGAIIFLIQMEEPIEKFVPNIKTYKEIKEKLIKAEKSGIKILAFSSIINKNEITINKNVKVDLLGKEFSK